MLAWLRLATSSSARFGAASPYLIVRKIPYLICRNAVAHYVAVGSAEKWNQGEIVRGGELCDAVGVPVAKLARPGFAGRWGILGRTAVIFIQDLAPSRCMEPDLI